MSATAAMTATDERLARAGDRLARAEAHDPLLRTGAGAAFVTGLHQGAPLDAALQRAGFGRTARGPFEGLAVGVPDPAAALLALARALERDHLRRRALRASALYALWLLLVALLLWWVVTSVAWPQLNQVLQAEKGPVLGPTLPAWPLILSGAAGVALLLWTIASLASSKLLPPFRAFGRACDRARSIGLAAELSRQGLPLPQAIRAASGLCLVHPLGEDARALAAALERGGERGPAGGLWLGPLGAALLQGLAAHGHGTTSLLEAAAHWERQADAELPWQRLRAEVTCLVAGGLAVGSAAVAFFFVYGRTFAGG